MIEKAMKRYAGFSATDTVFDYAICMECAEKMRNEFSRESLTKLDGYFASHFKIPMYPSDQDLDISDCIGKCMIKEVSKEELNEYQIYAYCEGNKLVKNIPPYMISGLAIEEVLPLISEKTTDFLNGFFNKHFSPDPDLMEPIPTNRLVFL